MKDAPTDEASPHLTCDNCGQRVRVEGVDEARYAHLHGSVFCLMNVATVGGRTEPGCPA